MVVEVALKFSGNVRCDENQILLKCNLRHVSGGQAQNMSKKKGKKLHLIFLGEKCVNRARGKDQCN